MHAHDTVWVATVCLPMGNCAHEKAQILLVTCCAANLQSDDPIWVQLVYVHAEDCPLSGRWPLSTWTQRPYRRQITFGVFVCHFHFLISSHYSLCIIACFSDFTVVSESATVVRWKDALFVLIFALNLSYLKNRIDFVLCYLIKLLEK